jgi:hypothetical protein
MVNKLIAWEEVTRIYNANKTFLYVDWKKKFYAKCKNPNRQIGKYIKERKFR